MSRCKSIAEAWQQYDEKVLPDVAGTVQRTECRKAFYAGAATVFGLLVHGVSKGDEPTAEDEALLDNIKAEIDEFLEEAMRKRDEAIARRANR